VEAITGSRGMLSDRKAMIKVSMNGYMLMETNETNSMRLSRKCHRSSGKLT